MAARVYTRGQIAGMNRTTTRRAFLSATAAAAGASAQPAFPIIDTHIHLFDTGRPQGVPWPPKDNATLYKPALPARYRALAVPLGIRGAIKVECSPWPEDNHWVLDIAEGDTIMVGTVGNLEPAHADFPRQLERLVANPLFRGIRYGNLWGMNLATSLSSTGFVAGLQRLADAGLTLDTANPDPALIDAVLRLTDRLPRLRVVIDHLPQMAPTPNLSEFARRPQVYVKISQVLRRVNGRVPADAGFYRARLEQIFNIFGEDRLIYGSDWPNSDQWAPYADVLRVVQEFFAGKGRQTAEKYFWKNSVAAYRWIRREPGQPG
jgi:predicted TIM-barrel fold metal-dependent hydrolase